MRAISSTESQGNFLGRISIRRNQVASAEEAADIEALESFHRKISDHFSVLLPSTDSSSASGDPVLSLSWLRKLLHAFLSSDADFKAALLVGRDPSLILKPPLDRFLPDFLDRTVKALDICNAISHGIEAVRFVHRHAEIAVASLQQRPFTDGQIRRAKKALATVLSSTAIDEKESSGSRYTERSWSFGHRGPKDPQTSGFQSLSWSVSKNWSASKQIQSLSANLSAPSGVGPCGAATMVYTMSLVLAFTMWALVAAIPCQERAGLGTHGPVPRQLGWAHGILGLQEQIAEDWKRKEKKGGGGGSAGLMDEVAKVEKVAHSLTDCLSQFEFPMEELKEAEVVAHVALIEEVLRRMEIGLGPLQKGIREVFHRIVRTRAEVSDVLDQAARASASNV